MKNITHPATIFRHVPFWIWNDKLDEAELRRQIREMADKGWGGYFAHSRVGLVTGYLSDEWMSLTSACADEAVKTGTSLWLYDEDKWPSGFAGGAVPEQSEDFRCRGLVLLHKGKACETDTVLAEVRHNGIDYEICKRVSPLGDLWFNGASYVDLMNPDAVRAFINCTHERYKTSCGEHFGKAIPGIFTDEPGYIFQNNYDVPAVPWSDHLVPFFESRNGYDIREKLPMLFFELDGYQKVRLDFYDAAAELFKNSYTKQYSDWCADNNLIMTGHFMGDDNLLEQTMWSGDLMSNYELMQWPGIDKLYRNLNGIIAPKQVSSVADQLGKERVLSEMFGCVGGQVSFFHRKWIGDWQNMLGVSLITAHLSLYSMRGDRKRDFPANFFYPQPWWQDERGFADYQARVCAAVSEGRRAVDLLIVQPLTSVWTEYTPVKKLEYGPWPRKMLAFDLPFEALSKELLSEKIDYHYGNETLMAKHGSTADAQLSIGRYSYGCVVIPPASNLRASTYALLKDYAESGGKLILIEPVPCRIDGELADIAFPGAQIVSTPEEAVSVIGELYPDRIKVVDRLSNANAFTVYAQARQVEGSTRYFLVNTNEKREVPATVTIPCAGDLAVIDLADGEVYKVSHDGGKFDVTLAAAGSLLITSGEEAKGINTPVPAVLGSGAMFEDVSSGTLVQKLSDFDCDVMEENVFLLNDFTLEMNGEKVYEGPVCGSWHTHFYPAKDGTPFKATYTFESECDVAGCFAVIEVAENLDSITFNGIAVKPVKSRGELGAFDPDKNWKDVSFTRVPLPGIAKGTNTLVIEGLKVNNITGKGFHRRVPDWQNHMATEAEEVYICGRFSLNRLSDSKYVISEFKKPLGKNLNDEGFPFYAGRVLLKSEFDLPRRDGKVFVQLNGADMACAKIKVNGQECGILRWKPFVADITNAVMEGTNKLEVEMVTTLVNAFGPNRSAGIKSVEGVGNYDFVNMFNIQGSYELFKFGFESVGIYVMGK